MRELRELLIALLIRMIEEEHAQYLEWAKRQDLGVDGCPVCVAARG